MRDIEYIKRQAGAYLRVLHFAYQHKYLLVLICETTDLINSICKELILCIGKTPSESLGENIRTMRHLNFDEATLVLIKRYYECQYCILNFESFDLLSFLCTVSCILLELRRCLLKYHADLADVVTQLGIDVCKYMETL